MFIPYKVDVPMQRWPVANWVLIGLTVLISLAMFGPLAEWENQRMGPMRYLPPEVQKAMRDAGVVSAEPEPSIVDAFMLQPRNFRVTQLVGNLFIHAGFMHLAGNMLFLFVFGNAVNAKLGHFKYVLVYLGVGVLESGIWVVAGPKAPCLGASGAIMGIIGAFLLLYPLNDVSVGYMFTFFYSGVYALSAMWVIAVYIAFDIWGLIRGGNSGVAYLAHVVGFGAGAASAATMLWFRFVEMDQNERSLLQAWHFMPEVDAGATPRRAIDGDTPEHAVRATARRAVAPVVRKKRDEGPIPLD